MDIFVVGCIYWNWDADITEWSFQKSAVKFNIDWAKHYSDTSRPDDG